MERTIYLSIVLLFFTTAAFSQIMPYNPGGKKWQSHNVYTTLGLDWVNYGELSADRIMGYAQNPEALQKNLSQMDEEVTAYTAGLVLQTGVALSPFKASTQSFLNNQELRIGIGLYTDKEAMLSYKNESLDTSIVYCNIHSEVALETAYLFKGNWGKRFIWFVGGGANAGLTFDNEMILMSGRYFGPDEHPSTQESFEENKEVFSAKPLYHLRAFIPYGLHFRASNAFSIGLEGRKGVGLQLLNGGGSNLMRKANAFALSARFYI